jgi:hypothetical protein
MSEPRIQSVGEESAWTLPKVSDEATSDSNRLSDVKPRKFEIRFFAYPEREENSR